MIGPRYYFDIRDFVGNNYAPSGIGMALIPYSVDSITGEYIPGTIANATVLAVDPNSGKYVADIKLSGYYDVYVHASSGYTLVRAKSWFVGEDSSSDEILRRRFTVGGADRIIDTTAGRQTIGFSATNYDHSVYAFSSTDGIAVGGISFDSELGMILAEIVPTMFAQERSMADIVFNKASTSEIVRSKAYII